MTKPRLLPVPVLAACAGALLAGGDASFPGADSPPWDGTTWRRFDDAATGLSFDVPMQGFRVESRHFDPKTPPGTVKDSLLVSGPAGLETTIDVFANPRKLPPERYFAEHLEFLVGPESSVYGSAAGVRRGSAILVDSPRRPGTFAQRTAVFAIGSRVLVVRCNDVEDARAVKGFERVLETLDAGRDER